MLHISFFLAYSKAFSSNLSFIFFLLTQSLHKSHDKVYTTDMKCSWIEAYINGFLSVNKYNSETVMQNKAKKKSEGTSTYMVMQ